MSTSAATDRMHEFKQQALGSVSDAVLLSTHLLEEAEKQRLAVAAQKAKRKNYGHG